MAKILLEYFEFLVLYLLSTWFVFFPMIINNYTVVSLATEQVYMVIK